MLIITKETNLIVQHVNLYGLLRRLCLLAKMMSGCLQTNNLIKCSVSVLILTIIAGCGFHLRGAIMFPTWLKSVYITPDDPYEPLQKNIRRILERNKITVVTEISKKTAVLELTTPDFTESILALNASGQAQRFRLTITFKYTLN